MSSSSKWSSPKLLLAGLIGVVILFGLWYAFRPEKLFVNKRVNETTPSGLNGALTALYTGRLTGEVHKTSGRVTIYQKADGSLLLQLTDFSTSNGPALHVLLVDGSNPGSSKDFSLSAIENVDLGELMGNQGNQSYPIPKGIDLKHLNRVTIYCERFHANFGSGALEEF
jgi:hypothetical protein